jgi:hypothetical protein
MLDQVKGDDMPEETAKLYHLLQHKRRQETRHVPEVCDQQGRVHSEDVAICSSFAEYFSRQYGPIPSESESTECLIKDLQEEGPLPDVEPFDTPITDSELMAAVKKGARKKAPGHDGLSLEFYESNWDLIQEELLELMNIMLRDRNVTSAQKHGIIVCLPKRSPATTHADYRPITLLTTEYKLLARIMAARLQQHFKDGLGRMQYCGLSGKTMHDVLTQIRDVMALSEHTARPMCLVSLDFDRAFDRVAHTYLFKMLRAYGISELACNKLKELYVGATARVQVNGQRSRPFEIMSGVRQGCPLSMVLFSMCLQPFLCRLKRGLAGLKVGSGREVMPIYAYADDVTLLVTDPSDFAVIQEAVDVYGRASGAKINIRKSHVLPLAGWAHVDPHLGMDLCMEIRVLGVRYGCTVRKSIELSWGNAVQRVKQNAGLSYHRHLCLAHRIQFVSVYLFAKLWFLAQILPPPRALLARLETVANWFIWHGAIFRVPLATLQRPREAGGWGLDKLTIKCNVLFYVRLLQCTQTDYGVTSFLLGLWKLNEPVANPPAKPGIPQAMQYLRSFALDIAYVKTADVLESKVALRRRRATVLQQLETNVAEAPPMRIVWRRPGVDWPHV